MAINYTREKLDNLEERLSNLLCYINDESTDYIEKLLDTTESILNYSDNVNCIDSLINETERVIESLEDETNGPVETEIMCKINVGMQKRGITLNELKDFPIILENLEMVRVVQ